MRGQGAAAAAAGGSSGGGGGRLCDAAAVDGGACPLFEPCSLTDPQAALLPAIGRDSDADLKLYRQFGRLMLRLIVEYPDGDCSR